MALTAAGDLTSGCHTFGAGLAMRHKRLRDLDSWEALYSIGGYIEARYNTVKQEWQTGGTGHRSIGRQLRVVMELLELTGDVIWRTLADKILDRLLNHMLNGVPKYWDERGIFHVGEWSTDAKLGSGAYARGARMYSIIEIAALADGLIRYLEVNDGAYLGEVKRRLLLMAKWHRDHGLDPYGEYGGLFMAADWPQPGMVYNHQYGLDDIPGPGISPTYTGAIVNLLTWGYLQTQDRSYLERAVLHFLRASTIIYNDIVRSRANFAARRIHRYMNSGYTSNTLYFGDPQHGDLFYASALPAVYLSAVDSGDVTAPEAPTLTLGSPVWSD
jgi:hypothetical protein